MSFFIRKQTLSSNANSFKRKSKGSKDEPKKKFNKGKNQTNLKNKKSESYLNDDSDDYLLSDNENVLSNQDSDEDNEVTAQEKKLLLAKKYLEEIEREEKERLEGQDVDSKVIVNRLKDDVLEQAGKLRKNVADKLIQVTESDISVLRCKEHKLAITCVVVSSDNKFIYSASKDSSIVKWSLDLKIKIKSILCQHKETDKQRKINAHNSPIISLAVSYNNKFLASGDESKTGLIRIWSADSLDHIHNFKGHRDAIFGLAFCRDTNHLYSCSKDRSVKIWNMDEMTYIETLFGHQSSITGIDVLSKDRAVTSGGTDNTVRVWKITEESQLIFNGHQRSIDMVKRLDPQHFITCGDDGLVCVWGILKKKPLCIIDSAHGLAAETNEPNWITCISTLSNSDVFASGSSDGFIKLWKSDDKYRTAKPLFAIPMVGFVNSLCFTTNETFLIAGVGQEHRLGRWSRLKEAKNCIAIISLKKKPGT